MYVSPNHPDRARLLGHQDPAPPPPEPTGHRLATLLRGPGAEVRVSLDEYNGSRFVSLRVWERGPAGWFPSRTGITVRRRELADVIEALQQAQAMLETPEPRPRPQPDPDTAPRPPWDEGQGQGRPAVEATPRPPRPEAPALGDDEPF